MKNKIPDYWDQTKDLRASLPNFMRPTNVFSDLNAENESLQDKDISFTEKINKNLLKYKEIKLVYNKTGISPAYYVYILLGCLFFILIGFFETYLTILIGTLYPLYISIKTLQNEETTKEDITQWLTYWVVYFLFINIECILGSFLLYIPFYFFGKVVLLLLLFLPQYNGAKIVYDIFIKGIFNKYENHIYDFSKKIVETISTNTTINSNNVAPTANTLTKND